MPIFTNDSTFPFDKFNLLNNSNFSTYSEIEKFVFIFEPHKFRGNLILLTHEFKNQYLFELLSIHILRLTFNRRIPRILESEINFKSIENRKEFINILNLKVNLEEITKELYKIENSEYVTVDSKQFLSQIIIFTYKYLFVKLAGSIYCNTRNGLSVTMDFKEQNVIFEKLIDNQEKEQKNSFHKASQIEYINNYIRSFNTDDLNLIASTIAELNIFSNDKKAIIKLNELIESNIHIDPNLSSIKKNRILLPFFKLITCVFYYKHFLDFEIDDPDFVAYFKKFRIRMKK